MPSMRLQPPGLALHMEGPGFLASPMRRVGGIQPRCRAREPTAALAPKAGAPCCQSVLQTVHAAVRELTTSSVTCTRSQCAAGLPGPGGWSTLGKCNTLSQGHRAAPHSATCMTHGRCAFAFVPSVRGKVEFDVNAPFPLRLRDWLTPFDTSVINSGVESVVLKGAVVWSPCASLRKKPASFCHATLTQAFTCFWAK
eukprot:692004-Amphidinium_carterae.1